MSLSYWDYDAPSVKRETLSIHQRRLTRPSPRTCARLSSVHSLSHTLLAAAFTGRFSLKVAWISSATRGASRKDREMEKPAMYA